MDGQCWGSRGAVTTNDFNFCVWLSDCDIQIVKQAEYASIKLKNIIRAMIS
jgi:hypothetical protein